MNVETIFFNNMAYLKIVELGGYDGSKEISRGHLQKKLCNVPLSTYSICAMVQNGCHVFSLVLVFFFLGRIKVNYVITRYYYLHRLLTHVCACSRHL